MDIKTMKNPYVPVLTVRETGVTAAQFTHRSDIHGPGHVNRVICLALYLTERTGNAKLLPDVWAAAYLHDLARRHDGECPHHGRWAVEEDFPSLQPYFAMAGARNWEWIKEAVIVHSMPEERPENPVCQLLKDADGLDRVRLNDLDESYLRLDETRRSVDIAEELYTLTNGMEDMCDIWEVTMDMELFARSLGRLDGSIQRA